VNITRAVIALALVGALAPALPAAAAGGTGTYDNLPAAYDNAGISTDDNPAAANLDGAGHSLSAETLTVAGWHRGAQVRVNAMDFTWPDTAPGAPDNVVAAGQRITVRGQGTALGFLAVGIGENATGTGKITYSDGSTEPYLLSVPDTWTGGRGTVLTLPRRNGPLPSAKPALFAREVPLAVGKLIRSVTLPTVPGLHVFSLALRRPAARWVGTWLTPIQGGYDYPDASEWCARIPLHVSTGGKTARIRVSNAFATQPLRIGHATIARQDGGAAVEPNSVRDLTFGGQRDVTIPAGGEAVSDAAPIVVPARSNLTVSLYLPGQSTHVTDHWYGLQTVYLSPSGGGDHTRETAGTSYPYTTTSFPYLSGVDVVPDQPTAGAVVTVGDSITDGAVSTIDANRRWPDYLAKRLGARSRGLGVLNAGINANRIVGPGPGENPPLLDRLDRDVFAQTGVKTVILLEGINDLSGGESTEQVIAGMREVAQRARAHHLKIIGGTIMPFKDKDTGGNWNAAKEQWRQTVNAFVRDGGAFDGYIDFAGAVADPVDPARMLTAYDSGDHLHPNEAGFRAMAGAINLDALY
jgi:lysophospholipase L1-like esterase